MKRYQILIFTVGLGVASGAMAKQEELFAAPVSAHMTLDGNTQFMKTNAFNVDAANHISMLNKQNDLTRFNVEPLSSSALQNHDSAAAGQGLNKGLTMLAALGLVILQLRRKHKSLPQRPIANSPNARIAVPN